MEKDKFHPSKLEEKLKKTTNAAGKPHFDPNYEEIKVKITPDQQMNPGKFKPDPLSPGHYVAHPVTIRAMRKDIFSAGSDEFLDLEESYICKKCKSELDLQFWHFCPYCETKFATD
jgi:hypothetical protein